MDLFTNRTPTPEQVRVLDRITELMIEVDGCFALMLPESRYHSLARTKLEECSMWAKKAAVFTVGVEQS